MKILYVSQYFPPEMGAPAARAAELSVHWVRMGHEVTVLTGFPNHPTGVVPEEWRSRMRRLYFTENRDGVNIVRTWLWPLPNRKAHERIRNYVSFFVSAAISGLGITKPDVVIGTSPQLLCALAGWWLGFCKRVPFVFEVRDLWPESLAAVGAGGEGTWLHRALGAIAGFLYRHAHRIVVVSPAFKDHLAKYWQVPLDRISVVENGVESDIFHFDSSATASVRSSLKIEGRFVVCYIGTMGNAHGLATLIEAADELQSALPGAIFLLIGEGAEKQKIVDMATARALTNIQFLGQQPRDQVPAYVSASDVCLVMLKKDDLFKTVIPTKLLEYMACERPVILGVDGQAREILENARGGLFVEPENSAALVAAVLNMADHPEQRAKMGLAGRQYILNNFSRMRKAQEYIAALRLI